MNSDTSDDALDAYVVASAKLQGLTIAPDWLPQVKLYLLATTRASDLVAAFPLPDEAEPAPVFEA